MVAAAKEPLRHSETDGVLMGSVGVCPWYIQLLNTLWNEPLLLSYLEGVVNG